MNSGAKPKIGRGLKIDYIFFVTEFSAQIKSSDAVVSRAIAKRIRLSTDGFLSPRSTSAIICRLSPEISSSLFNDKPMELRRSANNLDN